MNDYRISYMMLPISFQDKLGYADKFVAHAVYAPGYISIHNDHIIAYPTTNDCYSRDWS